MLSNTDFRVVFSCGNRKEKAMVVLTGTDGGIGGAKAIARFYASRDIPILAVACFKTKQMPSCLSEIPVEYVEAAVRWLKAQGYEKIAWDGIS